MIMERFTKTLVFRSSLCVCNISMAIDSLFSYQLQQWHSNRIVVFICVTSVIENDNRYKTRLRLNENNVSIYYECWRWFYSPLNGRVQGMLSSYSWDSTLIVCLDRVSLVDGWVVLGIKAISLYWNTCANNSIQTFTKPNCRDLIYIGVVWIRQYQQL